jgi:hypothetical protein
MRHGIASTLWESRDRVGGRCWSIRVFENAQTAEHGGQYIDTRHRQIRNLARELHVPLVDTEAQSFPAGAGDYFWFDGAFHTRDEIFADFPLVLDRLKKDYQQAGRYFYNRAGPDAVAFDRLTVNDWLDQNVPGGLTSLLAQAIERSNTGFWGLDGDQLSAINLFEFYLAPYPGADQRFRVAGGNDVIPARLAEELPAGTLRFEQPLEAAWTRSDGMIGLRFSGEASDVVADVAVFALPFTVLRNVDTSGLEVSDRRRRAIDTLAMGTNAKLQFQLNRSLVDVDWTGAFRSDDPEFGTWDSTYGQSDPHRRRPSSRSTRADAPAPGIPPTCPTGRRRRRSSTPRSTRSREASWTSARRTTGSPTSTPGWTTRGCTARTPGSPPASTRTSGVPREPRRERAVRRATHLDAQPGVSQPEGSRPASGPRDRCSTYSDRNARLHGANARRRGHVRLRTDK